MPVSHHLKWKEKRSLKQAREMVMTMAMYSSNSVNTQRKMPLASEEEVLKLFKANGYDFDQVLEECRENDAKAIVFSEWERMLHLVRDEFKDDPFSGDVFVFHNGAHDRVKLLVWDRNGFWLLYKRLEQGTFPFAVEGEGARVEITRAQLAMLLEGLEWKNARKSSHHTSTFDIQKRDGTHS